MKTKHPSCRYIADDLILLKEFHKIAQCNPDRIAIIDKNGNRKTSYATLEKMASSYAEFMKNSGIKKGDTITIELGRCAEHYAVMLACFFSGIVFVAVSDTLPQNRKDSLYTECKPVLNFKRDVMNRIQMTDTPFSADENLKKTDRGFITYTSGSTGKPKAVLHDRSIFFIPREIRRQIYRPIYSESGLDFDTSDVNHAAVADFSFVLSMTDFMFILFGKTVHIIDSAVIHDGIALKTYLLSNHIQSINILPGALYRLLPLPELRISLVAGESCTFDFSDCQAAVINVYGSSESPFVSYADAGSTNVVGYFLPGTRLWLDGDGEGEICYSGAGIMLGYINDQDLTAQMIETDDAGQKILHTRDIGRRTEDGFIQVIGRMDSIVKIRGMRVCTEEVAQALESVPGIDRAAIKVIRRGEELMMCGYYHPAGNPHSITIDDIRRELRRNLPDYMLPSLFVPVNEFPHNAHGKIDLSLLPNPSPHNDSLIPAIEKPGEKPDMEFVLFFITDAFKRILGADQVGPDDDFISLGGSSLMIMQLQLFIHQTYGVTVSAAELMDAGTPCRITDNINKLIQKNEREKLISPKYTFNDIVPLTESQLNVYFDEKMHVDSTKYNLPVKIIFDHYTAYDIERALNAVIDHRPVLKARIVDTEEGRALRFDASIRVSRDTFEDDFVRPFDLNKGLARFRLIENEKGCELLCDLHHMIGDGTTFRIIADDLFQELNHPGTLAFASCDNGILRQASFEQSIKGTEEEHKAKAFFDSMLSESEDAAPLIPSPDGRAGQIIRSIPVDKQQLTDFLKSKRLTVNQLLTSVFAYTLSRFTGSDLALFCLLEGGRGQINLQDSAGMFVRTLPMLIDCAYESAEDYLHAAGKRIRTAMSFDFYPLQLLKDTYHFTTDIQFQYAHQLRSIAADGITAEMMDHDTVAPFAVSVEDCSSGFSLQIRHDATYSDALCERIADSFISVFNGMLVDASLKDIRYTCISDLQEMEKTNRTNHALAYRNVLSAFEDQCEKRPSAKLVLSGNRSYTYKQGREIVSRIAQQLRTVPLDRGSYAAVLVPCSEWYLFAALGVIAGGAAYVPIITDFPDERIRFMLKDTSSSVLLVCNETAERGKSLAEDIPVLNIEAKAAVPVSGSRLEKIVKDKTADKNPGDISCVIYTSGSTGQPKGALLTGIGIANVCQWHMDYVGLTSESIYGMYQSYSFVSHVEPLFAPIFAGACIDIIPGAVRKDMAQLTGYIRAHGITNLKMGSSIGRSFVKESGLSSLKTLMLGGEKLGEITVPDGITVTDAYGPSEYTAQASATEVRSRRFVESVGYPIYNTKLYVLDSNLRPVPPGAVGQLCYSGLGMSAGYFSRPQETEVAFCDNPFSRGEPGYERLYLSGDMARVLPDGSFGIVGRKDSQVKINGNRVELSEVSSCIRELHEIQDSVVLPYNAGGNTSLAAYVVLNSEHDASLDDPVVLRDAVCTHVSKRKPDYMIPVCVIVLEKLPLNSNGKIDKHALPRPSQVTRRADYAAPRTEIEEKVVAAFKKAFGIDDIGLDDEFAILGGDSLKAIRIASDLRDYGLHALEIPRLRTPGYIAEHLSAENGLVETSDEERVKSLYVPFTKPGGKKLLFIHEVFSNVMVYAPIARYLNPGITFGALENYNLIYPGDIIETFDNAVEEALREVRIIQPKGPYNLGGWSYGGCLAYEMAYRLEQQGEVVENLFLMDSYFTPERPPLGIYRKMDRILPGWMMDLTVKWTLDSRQHMLLNMKTARRHKECLLANDEQLKDAVLRDIKAHTVYFSAIGNRKPTEAFLDMKKYPKPRSGITQKFLGFFDRILSKPLNPEVKMSDSQIIIQMNINHLNMIDEGPSAAVAEVINRTMLGD